MPVFSLLEESIHLDKTWNQQDPVLAKGEGWNLFGRWTLELYLQIKIVWKGLGRGDTQPPRHILGHGDLSGPVESWLPSHPIQLCCFSCGSPKQIFPGLKPSPINLMLQHLCFKSLWVTDLEKKTKLICVWREERLGNMKLSTSFQAAVQCP